MVNAKKNNNKDFEKISQFSESLILNNGNHIINIREEKLKPFIWWKGVTYPEEAFNPSITRGFLTLQLTLSSYLNRISSIRSNSDNALTYPYLKVLLNRHEIYRTKILDSSSNKWEEQIDIQIHYFDSEIEIQLLDMDETKGVQVDEYIGSAFFYLRNMQLNYNYDIIIKFTNQIGFLTNTLQLQSEGGEMKKSDTNQNKGNNDNDNDNCTNQNNTTVSNHTTHLKHKNTNASYKTSELKKNQVYNIRVYAKLISKHEMNNSKLTLSYITSLNFKSVYKTNPIIDNDLNIHELYQEIKNIKLVIDTIWLPFFLIIYNFASWRTPIYSTFFAVFFSFSYFFSKFFLSFFLVSLSLIIFVLVSIIKESDKLKNMDSSSLLDQKDRKQYKNWGQAKLSNGKSPSSVLRNSSRGNPTSIRNRKVINDKKELKEENHHRNVGDSESIESDSSGSREVSSDNTEENTEEDLSYAKESDNDSISNLTEDSSEEDANLSIIKSLVSSLLEDKILLNIKYIHFILFSISNISQCFFTVFRRFGYFLVILSWLLCVLNLFFYSLLTKLLRFTFFLCGFVMLTYHFRPLHVVYRFIGCLQQYYFIKLTNRTSDFFSRTQ